MALLADTVAGGLIEFGGIDDRTGPRIAEVLLGRTMATFAGDALLWECRRAILIQGAAHMKRGAGMAEHTFFTHRASEVGVRLVFVAGRKVVGSSTLVVGDRRLK